MMPKFFFLDTNTQGTEGAFAAVAASRAGAEVILVTVDEDVAQASQSILGEEATILTLAAIPADEIRQTVSEMDRIVLIGDATPSAFIHLISQDLGLPIVWSTEHPSGVIAEVADCIITSTSSQEEMLSVARDISTPATEQVVLRHGNDGVVFDTASNEALQFSLHGAHQEGVYETFFGFFLTILRQSENTHQAVRQAQFAVHKKTEYEGPLRESGEELAREMAEHDDEQKG